MRLEGVPDGGGAWPTKMSSLLGLGRQRELLEVCQEGHPRLTSSPAREGATVPLKDAPPTGLPLRDRQHSGVTSRSEVSD